MVSPGSAASAGDRLAHRAAGADEVAAVEPVALGARPQEHRQSGSASFQIVEELVVLVAALRRRRRSAAQARARPRCGERDHRRERVGAAMIEHPLILARAPRWRRRRPGRRRRAAASARGRRRCRTPPAGRRRAPRWPRPARPRPSAIAARRSARTPAWSRWSPDNPAWRASRARAPRCPSPTRPSAIAARNRGMVPGLSAALAVLRDDFAHAIRAPVADRRAALRSTPGAPSSRTPCR